MTLKFVMPTELNVGDELETKQGIQITILAIRVINFHLSTNRTIIKYKWNDGDLSGEEENSLEYFRNSIIV